MLASYYKNIYDLLCRKHPNKKIFVISDHHFFHSNIIKYHRSEFNDVLSMNEHIINTHNSVVGSDDIVIFLGDFSFKKSIIKEYLKRMNGHKYLILGNHDFTDISKNYSTLGFEGVYTTPIRINDSYLSHEPLIIDNESNVHFKILVKEFSKCSGHNYHGHIHTTDKGKEPFTNVCCEAQNYKPLFIGYTTSLDKTFNNPLIINSEQFDKVLSLLKERKNFDSNFIIADYIYSMMLDKATPYMGSCYIYGSFPLYKKYGYISNFSDLDVGLVYDESISKSKNYERIKLIADTVYESLLGIDNINLSFYKRIASMCIFEALYSNGKGNYYKAFYDSNLVPLNVYRDSDFIVRSDCSLIERSLTYTNPELIEGFDMPRFTARFLTCNGNMANIILQCLFQKGYYERKALALNKLKYIYRNDGNKDISNVSELEDVLIRFFIRNVLFFHTTRRSTEIAYLEQGRKNIEKFISLLPLSLKLQLEEILVNPNSLFNKVYSELSSSEFSDIPDKSKELVKTIIR